MAVREAPVLRLLRDCPELSIDLVEAAVAQQASTHLRAKWREFVSFASGEVLGPWPAWRRPGTTGLSSFRSRFDNEDLTSRAHLAERAKVINRNGRQVWLKQTSGTTGTPLSIPYSLEFHFEQRFLDIPKILFIRGVVQKQCDVQCVHITDTSTTDPAVFVSPLDATSVYASLRIDNPNFKSSLAALNPQVISSRPELLEIACRKGLLSGLTFNAVVSAGSFLSEQRRKLIRQETGVDCLNVYALSEVGIVASECAMGHLHVHEDAVHVEVLCENSGLAQEGFGEFVVSSFANEEFPLVRYRTQDRGALERKRCACGHAGARLTVVEGRTVPLFSLGNIPWSPSCFYRLPFDFPVGEYQIRQIAAREIEIAIQLGSPRADSSKVEADVQAYAMSRVPNGTSVRTTVCEFHPSRKHVRYVVL